MLDRLVRRFGRLHANGPWRGPRYIVAEHVRMLQQHPFGHGERIADFMAVDTWPSSGWALHGAEVKCSRSDWLAELRDPTKAGAFLPFVDHWWLVVSDPKIVRPDEIPADWGCLAARGAGLAVVTPAPKLQPLGTPPSLVAGFARSVQQTAARAPHMARVVR